MQHAWYHIIMHVIQWKLSIVAWPPLGNNIMAVIYGGFSLGVAIEVSLCNNYA